MSRITTARAIVHHMEEPLSIARMIPPTPMMGAKKKHPHHHENQHGNLGDIVCGTGD
jgi:hypothetical protein